MVTVYNNINHYCIYKPQSSAVQLSEKVKLSLLEDFCIIIRVYCKGDARATCIIHFLGVSAVFFVYTFSSSCHYDVSWCFKEFIWILIVSIFAGRLDDVVHL